MRFHFQFQGDLCTVDFRSPEECVVLGQLAFRGAAKEDRSDVQELFRIVLKLLDHPMIVVEE